jgi:hypothetical protein
MWGMWSQFKLPPSINSNKVQWVFFVDVFHYAMRKTSGAPKNKFQDLRCIFPQNNWYLPTLFLAIMSWFQYPNRLSLQCPGLSILWLPFFLWSCPALFLILSPSYAYLTSCHSPQPWLFCNFKHFTFSLLTPSYCSSSLPSVIFLFYLWNFICIDFHSFLNPSLLFPI